MSRGALAGRPKATANRAGGAGPRGRADRPATTHEYAYHALRSAILKGEIPSGTRLIQTELADRLGVSVTPIREALRQLGAEHLVDNDPHRGAVVRQLALQDVCEIYELRMVLEPLMMRRVVSSLSDERLREAEALQEQMAVEQDVSTWMDLNRRFHEVLYAGEPGWLASILAMLRDAATVFVGLSFQADPHLIGSSNDEHRELVAAYRRGDVERAVDLTVQHLQATLSSIETAYREGRIDLR